MLNERQMSILAYITEHGEAKNAALQSLIGDCSMMTLWRDLTKLEQEGRIIRIRGGAMASSVGHDNHNIIVLGDSFEDMALAVNRCAELGGGQVIVRNGEIAAEVAYPVCGLLRDLSLDELADKKKELNRVAHEMGTEIAIPFMFLSFICLAAIPAYAITDCGFIDVVKQQVVDPLLEVVE